MNHYQHSNIVPDGFTIKRVPFGMLSDSIFTPDLPHRPTQTTIGYYTEEAKSIADHSYGLHRSKYGGTGVTKVTLGKHELFTTRKTNSFLTAVHSSPEPPLSEKIRANRILRHKGFFAAPINQVACDVFRLATESKPLPRPAPQQVFPRSVAYEIEYAKEEYHKANMEALEKERKQLEDLIKSQKNTLQHTVEKPLSIIGQGEITLPEKDKTTEVGKEYCSQSTMEKNKVENQKENTESLPCTSVCGLCGCTLSRGACPTCKTEKESLNLKTMFDKTNAKWKPIPPKFVIPWGEQRQAEMMKVNYPFKTEAVRWYYQSFLHPESSARALSKTRFPENKFSSLNI